MADDQPRLVDDEQMFILVNDPIRKIPGCDQRRLRSDLHAHRRWLQPSVWALAAVPPTGGKQNKFLRIGDAIRLDPNNFCPTAPETASERIRPVDWPALSFAKDMGTMRRLMLIKPCIGCRFQRRAMNDFPKQGDLPVQANEDTGWHSWIADARNPFGVILFLVNQPERN